MGEEAEDEEWGGIAVDGEGDVEMGEEDEDEGPEDGVFRKQRPEEVEAGMMDDEEPTVELSSSALSLFADLPLQLLKLAQPTPLSFIRHADESTTAAPSTLLPTTADAPSSTPTTTADLPSPLLPIAEILTTLHVRALECLNNLYITLARAATSPSVATFLASEKQVADLQSVWEGTLGLVQGAAEGAGVVEKGKEGEVEESESRRMEVVGAGVGAAWGMARIGLVVASEEEDTVGGKLVSFAGGWVGTARGGVRREVDDFDVRADCWPFDHAVPRHHVLAPLCHCCHSRRRGRARSYRRRFGMDRTSRGRVGRGE